MKARLTLDVVISLLAVALLGYLATEADSSAVRGGACFCLWAALGGTGIVGLMTAGGWFCGVRAARRRRPQRQTPP